jgi:hypothetical protein
MHWRWIFYILASHPTYLHMLGPHASLVGLLPSEALFRAIPCRVGLVGLPPLISPYEGGPVEFYVAFLVFLLHSNMDLQLVSQYKA